MLLLAHLFCFIPASSLPEKESTNAKGSVVRSWCFCKTLIRVEARNLATLPRASSALLTKWSRPGKQKKKRGREGGTLKAEGGGMPFFLKDLSSLSSSFHSPSTLPPLRQVASGGLARDLLLFLLPTVRSSLARRQEQPRSCSQPAIHSSRPLSSSHSSVFHKRPPGRNELFSLPLVGHATKKRL